MKVSLKITQDTNGGIITIIEGETPVIYATTEELTVYAPCVVNFLRCGCPQVQIYTPYKEEEVKKPLISVLRALQLNGEKFIVNGKLPVFVIKRQ